MSKSLIIKKVTNQDLILDYTVLKNTFSSVDSHVIANSPWKEQFPYTPEVTFQIAHSLDYIAIYYKVQEEFVRAQAIRPNEKVWEDSCVEFFVSLDNKQTYFNFEFNVLGTGLIGFGPAVKSERKRLTATEIDSVDTFTLVSKHSAKKKWEIFLLIPKGLISKEELEGRTIHANFYKCGDGLPQPHFISWNPISHSKPNFHLPEFFGELILE